MAHRLQLMTRLLPSMRRNWLALVGVGAASYKPSKACPLDHFSLYRSTVTERPGCMILMMSYAKDVITTCQYTTYYT